MLSLIAVCFILCARTTTGLRDLSSTSTGPDEFLVEPRTQLETPPDMRSLPPPTPGGANRTDNDPIGEAIVALGGRPGNVSAPIPAADGALITASSRYGVVPNIRETLAAEDAEFRRRKGRFTQYRLFSEDLYEQVYRSQALDPYAIASAWRRAGVATPSFPPSNN